MDNPQYNWVNQMVKQSMHKKKRAKYILKDMKEGINLIEDCK